MLQKTPKNIYRYTAQSYILAKNIKLWLLRKEKKKHKKNARTVPRPNTWLGIRGLSSVRFFKDGGQNVERQNDKFENVKKAKRDKTSRKQNVKKWKNGFVK